MAALEAIEDAVELGKAYYTELITAFMADLKSGTCNSTLSGIKCLRRLIRALEWDVEISNMDDTTVKLYSLLLKSIAVYTGSTLPVNPNVYIPGTTIIVDGGNTYELSFTNADLVPYDVNGDTIYYLPIVEEDGNVPSLTAAKILLNGDELVGSKLVASVSPNRIYGFSDNAASTIIVTYNKL